MGGFCFLIALLCVVPPHTNITQPPHAAARPPSLGKRKVLDPPSQAAPGPLLETALTPSQAEGDEPGEGAGWKVI